MPIFTGLLNRPNSSATTVASAITITKTLTIGSVVARSIE